MLYSAAPGQMEQLPKEKFLSCSSKHSFSFGEHYGEVNHLIHCLLWSQISLSSNLPSFLCLDPHLLRSWVVASHHQKKRTSVFPLSFNVVAIRMVAFPIFWICLLVACSAKAPRDTHCYLCGLSVSRLNLCILYYWSSCGKLFTALSKRLGNDSVTKTYICP